jgi:hypothetical protein
MKLEFENLVWKKSQECTEYEETGELNSSLNMQMSILLTKGPQVLGVGEG